MSLQDDPGLRDVFLDAADLPPDQRSGFLDGACGSNPALRAEVESLLERLDEGGGEFEPANCPPTEMYPERVGRYRIIEPIGEGGMGTVYLAEQEYPVRRTVALKLIKLGMDTKQVVARFNAERQALAMMNHPHIARVFDAGATDTGRPYFVMELVEGVPVTEFCDAHRLGVRDRLELFAQVCQAVQHAHTKGVIHRDLKPSNVLVTQQDGAPVPKVIDFGIAKATQGRLAERMLTTGAWQWIGTPQYMSPEQADGGGDVDTRSDVYSLGVLLYELLTGLTPFDFGTAGYSKVQRVIRESDPPLPSVRLPSRRELKGDLDRIVLKAMEKDWSRRYETALGLALDVQRYLRHEPVAARQGTSLYRIRKLVRRNRLVFGAAAVVVLSAALATAGFIYAALRDARQRDAHLKDLKAEHARTLDAQAESESVNRFIAEMLDSSSEHSLFRSSAGNSPATQPADTTVREMLDRATRRLDHGELKDQPKGEAQVRTTLARAYRGIGLLPLATEQFRQALAIRLRLFGPDNLDVASSLNDLGYVLRFQSRFDDAEPVLRDALRVRRKLLGSENLDVAETLDNLGQVLGSKGDYRGGEEALREALRLQRALRTGDHSDTASISDSLGIVLQYKGDLDGAEQAFRESLRVRRELSGGQDPLMGRALTRCGMVLGWKGELASAESHQWQALAIYRNRSLRDHPDVGNAWNWLGLTLESEGDYAGAEDAFREAKRIWYKTMDEDNPDRQAPANNLARVLLAQGNRSTGRELEREIAENALDRATKALAAKPGDARLLTNRAWALARLEQFEPALQELDRAIEMDPKQHVWWQWRACLRLYLGQDQQYRQECRQMLQRWSGTSDAMIGEAVAKTCLLGPDPVEDVAVLRRLAELHRPGPIAPWLAPWFQQTRALAAYRSGDSAGAIEILNSPQARFPYAGRGRCSAADFYLAIALYHTGHLQEAQDALRRGVQRSETIMLKPGEGSIGPDPATWLISQIARREAEALVHGAGYETPAGHSGEAGDQ